MTGLPSPARKATGSVIDPIELLDRAAGLGITDASDKTGMKERIMIAYEHGHLTPFEARVLVLTLGLEAA